MSSVALDAERIALAEEFLREAVFRSRGLPSTWSAVASAGPCGLGERAAAAPDLSPRAEEILRRLRLGDAAREPAARWVEKQDALDRKRNHFLKDFRARNGFDRTRYPAEVRAEFESGIARINAEEDAERRAAAEKLLSGAG